jgi:hypothetical protein
MAAMSHGRIRACQFPRSFCERQVDRALRRTMFWLSGFAVIILASRAERPIHHRASSEIVRCLFALGANDDSGYVGGINRGVEKFRAGQLRKMNELVSDFLDFPTNLLPGLHSQLDHLADVPLQNADDSIAGL